ncbi:hypothetical protein [Rhizobium sp.]
MKSNEQFLRIKLIGLIEVAASGKLAVTYLALASVAAGAGKLIGLW